MGIKRRTGSTKNPPILSHEFLIQNHADIVSCIAMVFVLGLLFQVSSKITSLKIEINGFLFHHQATSPLASLFVAMSHNTTDPFETTDGIVMYTYGMKDLALTFFYFLICIVMHAVVQEYFLDVRSMAAKSRQCRLTFIQQLAS